MSSPPESSAKGGSVLVFALLIMVVAAVAVGGIAQLAATRALVGSREWEEARERITLGNSRAMAREYLLSQIFRVPAQIGTLTNTNSLGGFTITSTNISTNFWAALSGILGTGIASSELMVNPFNPFERGGLYPRTIVGSLSDGTIKTNTWYFQVRLRNPIAAGYAFVRHVSVVGHSMSVLGEPLPRTYLDLTKSNVSESFTGFGMVPGVSVYSSAEADLRPGEISSAQPDQSGLVAFTNFIITNLFGGTMVLRANIASAADANYILTVPSTNGAGAPVARIDLTGDTNRAGRPFFVFIPASNTNLNYVQLIQNNSRPVYLTRQSSPSNVGPASFIFEQYATDWRIAATVSLSAAYPEVFFKHGANAGFTNTGGLATDAKVTGVGGASVFKPDLDPAGLDFIGDKMMWLEDHRVPALP